MKKVYLWSLAFLGMWSCGRPVSQGILVSENYVDTTVTYRLVDSHVQSNKQLDSMVLVYKSDMDAAMNQVLAYTARPLTKAQPESTLGYLAVDALYDYAKSKDTAVVGSVVNYGGLRINYVASGQVTIGQIYEIMPFDNTVVIINVPGRVLKQWCNHMAMKGGWPIYGVQYKIKDKEAIDVTVNGKSINDNIEYKIATTDYLANGGDDCEFLKPLKKMSYNKFHRDSMLDFLKSLSAKGDTLNYQLENRVLNHE